jgi:peptidyl-prolyl cis-trans isomerase C
VKKDILISIIAVIVVAGVCFGLAAVRPPFQPTKSQPFSLAPTPGIQPTAGRIVMRVNGEAVTEAEFQAAFKQLPEEVQRQFASEPGKMMFAEQLVRMKLLEQEARRLGLENDPQIAGVIAARRTDVLADAAAEKLIPQPTPEAVNQFYVKNRNRFETLDLSHILIAYAGGLVPPRSGPAPTETDAMNKALVVYAELQKGADFRDLARKYSDDVASAAHGGELGPVGPGMLPQELEARVFQIPVGRYSGPIPSRIGIHIFRVNAKGARPLEEVRQGLAQRLRQQDMYGRLEVLRKSAKVDFDPKFFPEAKRPPLSRKPS